MDEQKLSQHIGTSETTTDETGLTGLVRRCFSDLVHSAGVEQLVRTTVNLLQQVVHVLSSNNIVETGANN